MTDTNESRQDLIHALEDAKSILEEMQHSSSQNFDDIFKRYAWTLRPDGQIGTLLTPLLPDTDFQEWYSAIKATQRQMVGSAKLSWPNERNERIAIQYTLIRLISLDKIKLNNFAHNFTYVRGTITDNYIAFFERILVPFHNELLKLLRKYIETDEEELAGDVPNKMQSDQIFKEIANHIKEGNIPDIIAAQILSDLAEARLAFNGGAFKGCVVMLGASLEGIMLGTLQRSDVLDGLSTGSIPAPIMISSIGTGNPDLSNKMAQKLSFEDMKNCLNQIIEGLVTLRVDDIQDFRNAVHPWKAVTEPAKFANIDQARALQFIASLKKIADHVLPWRPS